MILTKINPKSFRIHRVICLVPEKTKGQRNEKGNSKPSNLARTKENTVKWEMRKTQYNTYNNCPKPREKKKKETLP